MSTVRLQPENPGSLYLYGPTLQVEVGFDPDFVANDAGIPQLTSGRLPALVDTGARDSAIDSALAASLNLPIVDRATVAGVSGSFDVNVHLCQMYIPELNWVIFGRFTGVHLSAGGQPHVALLGRAFLNDYSMNYDGRTGIVTLTR